jgi:protein-S-isoprenylcysteine O-methyltransferase Ste14
MAGILLDDRPGLFLEGEMTTTMSRVGLLAQALIRLLGGFIGMGVIFFLPAGTLNYWQGWLFLGVVIGLVAAMLVYLMLTAPDLLERRMRMRERSQGQPAIIRAGALLMLLAAILPGLDVRFGWSQMPPWVAIAANGVFVLGYIFFGLVLRENHYASRIIEVEKGQQVISTGPYMLVRHPMYLALVIMFLAVPLALGSYWAVLPALILPLVLVFRIITEEAFLAKELPGYSEYRQRVRYRLIPGVW